MNADERKMSIAFDNMEIESEAGLKDLKLNERWGNTFFISRPCFLRCWECQESREMNGIEAWGRCGVKRNFFMGDIRDWLNVNRNN